VVRKSPDWRAGERAKTLLLLSQPLLSREVAKLQDLNIETVCVTWQRWAKEGMDAFFDKAPQRRTAQARRGSCRERLLQWARQEPLSATELLQRHIEAQGLPVEVNTLIRALKANGMVWKRTRHSLKKRERPPPSPTPAKRSTS
jgi:transposase